jgi:hypothetical protein
MNDARLITLCGICGTGVCKEGTVCSECQRAFDQASGTGIGTETGQLDLDKYSPRMFPWEHSVTAPRLIGVHPGWLLLALGMVVLVLLLALIRTPLPSCWEISS